MSLESIVPSHQRAARVFLCEAERALVCGVPQARKGGTLNSQERIRQALIGSNEDQKRIAETGLDFVATILAKNADYGSSVWHAPLMKPTLDCGDAILVRMSDKVARIASLSSQDAQVTESLEDTMKDLGAYALLWLSRPKLTNQVL